MKLELVEHVKVAGEVYGLTLAGNRLLVLRGMAPTLVLDATSGKLVTELPKGSTIYAVDAAGGLAVVHDDGKTVGGRYEWGSSLWDLAKGKKLAPLAKNTPDDNITPATFGATRLLTVRKRKTTYSFRLYDRAGKMVAEHGLGKVLLPFRAVMSPDERLAAHAYFTGAAHLVDLTTGESRKLAGGALRIGRQHEKGISDLVFDAAGEHLMYHSGGADAVHVWSVRSRKTLPGKWTTASSSDAFFVGDELVLVRGRSGEATMSVFSLAGKAEPRVIPVGEHAMRFASVGDGRHVACAGATGFDPAAKQSLAVWDVTSGKRAAKGTVPTAMKAVGAIAASPARVALGDRKVGVALYAFG